MGNAKRLNKDVDKGGDNAFCDLDLDNKELVKDTISELESVIKNQRELMEILKNSNNTNAEKYEKQIKQRDEVINKSLEENCKLKQDLEEKNKTITKAEETIQALEEKIERLQHELHKRDMIERKAEPKITPNEELILNLFNDINALRREKTNLEIKLSIRNEYINKINLEIEQKDDEINRIKRVFSAYMINQEHINNDKDKQPSKKCNCAETKSHECDCNKKQSDNLFDEFKSLADDLEKIILISKEVEKQSCACNSKNEKPKNLQSQIKDDIDKMFSEVKAIPIPTEIAYLLKQMIKI